jgi:hypothetical protein
MNRRKMQLLTAATVMVGMSLSANSWAHTATGGLQHATKASTAVKGMGPFGMGGMGSGSMGSGMGSGGMGSGGMGNGGMVSGGTGTGTGGFGFNGSWSWSWPIWPDGYGGYSGSGYSSSGTMTPQQYQWAALQSQWAADERARMAANANAAAYQRPAKEPKPKAAANVRRAESPGTSPPIDLTPAERGARKLKLAKLLAADGKTADAAEYYTEIIAKYPATPAASEAQTLLDQKSR